MGRDLPSGTVTFMFTDIEGSTRLLHELGPDRYGEELAEHRRVLRAAFEHEGGVEVDTQGDAFFVAFATAPEAVAAAKRAQRALSLRVRIGIHTGRAHVRDKGYVGSDVHLGARIAGCGHGGQVLLSASTGALVAEELTDLGEHRLKDFDRPITIFQLGRDRFPPLRTISNTNLPHPASSFLGRGQELRELTELIRDGARLVTLTGPGGSGKTRLALEAATALVPEFKAGVFWIGLAPLRDPTLVMETIAEALGARESLATNIAERELMLLIDNVEQVIESAPELAMLVEACPNLRLLVTSRERLRVRGEVDYSVPALEDREAVELFCARSGLEADDIVRELCGRLDNLPLAVELAAARTTALSPSQILERVSRRLDLLRGGRDAEARQQTLRATVEWSHDLLEAKEQRLFAGLSVFAGGCTLESADVVTAPELDLLQSLVEKNLLRQSEERFWMLETIREFATERLEESNDADALRERHAEYFTDVAEAIRDDGMPHAVLEVERDNFRAALEWAARSGRDAIVRRLVLALHAFWFGHLAEAKGWIDRALAGAAEGSRERNRLQMLDAQTSILRGEFSAAERQLDAALELARALGDVDRQAQALIVSGNCKYGQGELDEAARLYARSAVLYRRLEHQMGLSGALSNLGSVALERGDLEKAATLQERALALKRGTDDPELTYVLCELAWLALAQNEPSRATAYAHEALTTASEAPKPSGASRALQTSYALEVVACVEAAAAQVERAARLLGASESVFTAVGRTRAAIDSERHLRAMSQVRAALGESRFDRAWRDGFQMSLDDAVAYALASDAV